MDWKKHHKLWNRIDKGLEGIEQIHIKQIGGDFNEANCSLP